MTSSDNERYVYHRYRRPGIFAHGQLGTIDDVFVGQGTELADRALTIDPDAQLIGIAQLTSAFCEVFNDEFDLGMKGTIDVLDARIESSIMAHNDRRSRGG
jgi:hypothetical protein